MFNLPIFTFNLVGEEARRHLHKNVASNIEQVLVTIPHKAPTIRPPASHHENYPSWTNQTCRILLEKQWRAHKWCTPMDPHIWPGKSKATSSNIHTAVMWGSDAGHCWRSRDELIRDVLLWTPTHGRAKAGRPARTYIQQLCEDTECCPEDLPRAINDREKWRERVSDICAISATWWWWFWVLII